MSYDKKEGEHFNLEIVAIHSFSRLCYLQINPILEFSKIQFKDLVHLITSRAKISSKITISKVISESTVEGFTKKTNAFRFFKEICFQKNAIVKFNSDNSVSILDRAEYIHNMRTQTPHVIDMAKDVSSWKTSN